jgi:hypothetical protein
MPTADAARAPATKPAGGQRRTSKLEAAGLLAAGRYREALDAYRRLAEEAPHEPVHGMIAAILQRRLTEQCGSAALRGPACE